MEKEGQVLDISQTIGSQFKNDIERQIKSTYLEAVNKAVDEEIGHTIVCGCGNCKNKANYLATWVSEMQQLDDGMIEEVITTTEYSLMLQSLLASIPSEERR